MRPRRFAVLMALSLALFTALAISSAWTLRSVAEATEVRARARDALLTSAQLLAALVDIETGQRGFLLTGDREYLQPYDAGLRDYPPLLAALEDEGTRYAEVAPRLRELAPLVQRRIYLAQRNIAVRASDDFDAVEIPLLTREGQAVMTAIRANLHGIERSLRAEIDRQDIRVKRISRTALIAEVLLGVVGALALILGTVLLLREQTRRVAVENELQAANDALEGRVSARTQELEQARTQINDFAVQLDQTVEAERRRLSREVHDQLGQLFTALKLTWERVASQYALRDDERVEVHRLLDEGVATTRRISSELRPPLLDELGLGAALEHKGESFTAETGIECVVDVLESEGLAREQATQLFRIVQEALTNVARHAQAHTVWLNGQRVGATYELGIEDDGRGLDDLRPGSTGMAGMRERATLAGGHLDVERGLHSGLRLRVTVPIRGP